MAITKVTSNDAVNQQYCQVDNAAAPTFPTLDSSSEHIGYDSTYAGAVSQATNPSGQNASVPDFVSNQTKEVIAGTANSTASAIYFKNPS